jgi:hypothetical protein
MSQESKLDFIKKGLSDLHLELGERSRKSSSPEQLQLGRSPDQVLHASQLEWHEKRLADLLTAEHDIRQEQRILASLDFQSRHVRCESIQEACASTFEWTFNNSDFARWAKSECGVFWIAGKAGSGKSTLMKHITNHDSTRDMLGSWACPKMAVITTHYFWAAGTSIQKSHQGLLQSILYDIFRECPTCIPIACPARWSKTGQQTSTWSMTELSTSLNKLVMEDELPTKFCFFIDGLDEFGDDHLELCEVIRDLSRSPHIKLCVSSRPLNVFTKNFGEDPCKRIYVHDLTEGDIIKFAQIQLEKHPRWEVCGALAEDMNCLVRDIGHKAEGVFLWAFLVTRSLRDGLTNEDTMQELRKRLDSLPTDLERLFMHMLNKIDPIYHEKMAGMLQIAVHAKEPLLLDVYGFHEKEYEDKDYAINYEVKERDPGETSTIRSQTMHRINARSSGLLEVRDYTVQFLHRTVGDFLKTREMIDYLELKSKPGFDPYCSIVKAFVAVIKCGRFEDGVVRQRPPRRASSELIVLLQGTLDYASEAEKCSLREIVDLLDELEYALVDIFETQQAHFIFGECHPKLLFREEILRSNVSGYIAKKLSELPEYLFDFEASPLSVALEIDLPYVDTIRVLLQTGEDPNERSMLSDTEYVEPWVRFTYDASPWSVTPLGRRPFNFLLDNGFFSLFLSYGADPNGKMPGYDFTVFAMYLMTIFSDYIKNESEYLRTLDDFLGKGADLEIPLLLNRDFFGRSQLGSRWWPDLGKRTTVLCAFVRGLRNSETSGGRLAKGRFIAEVTRRLILKGVVIEGEIIQAVFGEHLGTPLLKLMNDIVDPNRPQKRQLETEGREETTSKRQLR